MYVTTRLNVMEARKVILSGKLFFESLFILSCVGDAMFLQNW